LDEARQISFPISAIAQAQDQGGLIEMMNLIAIRLIDEVGRRSRVDLEAPKSHRIIG
jgi:hypothetical protein